MRWFDAAIVLPLTAGGLMFAGFDAEADDAAGSSDSNAVAGMAQQATTPEDARLRLGETDKPGIYGPMGTRYYFDDGFRYENGLLRLRMALVGRFHLDGVVASQDDGVKAAVGTIRDEFFVRRLRLDLRGNWGEHLDFQAQYDVADDEIAFRKVYLDLVGFRPFDALRIGYFPEPIGLEHLMSSNHSTFLERGLPYALNPRSNAGMSVRNAFSKARLVCEVGAFNEVDGYDERPSGTWGGTARVAGVPWMHQDAGGAVHLDRFVHLGVAASLRAPKDGVAYSTRPETGSGPKYLSVSAPDSDRAELLGTEAAFTWGPLSLQGEWMRSVVADAYMGDDATYDGGYAYVSYILTGETRTYDRQRGYFRSVTPRRPFAAGGGPGAWEVAARLSSVDLTGGSPADTAGKLRDLTFGLNWYWNPHARVMLNYVVADLDRPDVDGDTRILEVRVQLAY